METGEIIQEVSKYPCKSVSITGGEPLLQRNGVLGLVKKLKELNYWVQINTNGTIFDEEIFRLVDLISMDHKCPSSRMNSDFKVLKRTRKLFNSKTQFKFIISDKEDYRYAKKIVSSLDATNVVFQPEWSNRKFTKRLVELVKKDNLNAKIILQQQKMIWGVKRGV
jgi:Organic radical activating enzymes